MLERPRIINVDESQANVLCAAIKIDNKESNLKCLCIKCHSEVDQRHRENFSSKASQLMIKQYMDKYHNGERNLPPQKA